MVFNREHARPKNYSIFISLYTGLRYRHPMCARFAEKSEGRDGRDIEKCFRQHRTLSQP